MVLEAYFSVRLLHLKTTETMKNKPATSRGCLLEVFKYIKPTNRHPKRMLLEGLGYLETFFFFFAFYRFQHPKRVFLSPGMSHFEIAWAAMDVWRKQRFCERVIESFAKIAEESPPKKFKAEQPCRKNRNISPSRLTKEGLSIFFGFSHLRNLLGHVFEAQQFFFAKGVARLAQWSLIHFFVRFHRGSWPAGCTISSIIL